MELDGPDVGGRERVVCAVDVFDRCIALNEGARIAKETQRSRAEDLLKAFYAADRSRSIVPFQMLIIAGRTRFEAVSLVAWRTSDGWLVTLADTES